MILDLSGTHCRNLYYIMILTNIKRKVELLKITTKIILFKFKIFKKYLKLYYPKEIV